MNVPDRIAVADLDCVVMPNDEVICLGKTLGRVGDFGEHLKPQDVEGKAPTKSEIKVIGVHDACTYKPMIVFRAVPENEHERRMLARAGFGLEPEEQAEYTFFYDVNREDCSYDSYKLEDQCSCGTAARFIRDELGFDMLAHGAFLDCECIRGESAHPMSFADEFDQRAISMTTKTT